MAYLRKRGVRLIIYIDDMLIMADSKNKASLHMLLALDVLESLGFVINYGKSVLTPTHEINFLGFLVNTAHMIISLPPEKVQKVVADAQTILDTKTPTARQLARTVGLLSSCIPAVTPAPLYYRHLQRVKNRAVAQGGYNQITTLTPEARQELIWWSLLLKINNGKPVRSPQPDMVMYSDASYLGWGATCQSTHIGGAWTQVV